MHRLAPLLLCATLAGCDDDPAPGGDGGLDSSGGGDARADGMRDARPDARTDAPPDPCATDTDPYDTLGCNGAILGPGRAANEFGGRCELSDFAEGTCVFDFAYCWSNEAETEGICLIECDPAATYISTGDCPTGSRCYTFDVEAFCFPDCESGDDCATETCDEEGACIAFEPEGDGGTDAGGDASADAGPDAAVDAPADVGATG
jgi:hypothetical protein